MISLKQYGQAITSKEIALKILAQIQKDLHTAPVVIDFSDVFTITTSCAKLIFGPLYKKLGPDKFLNDIEFVGINEDIEIIVKEGIADYIDEINTKYNS